MLDVTIHGFERLNRSLASIAEGFVDKAARALEAEAEIEMTEAKRRTPVDTGALRASGHVKPARRHGREISVTLAFGGPAAPYAVYVHEDLDAYHPTGEAKFLERTINESAPHMAARVARRMRGMGG